VRGTQPVFVSKHHCMTIHVPVLAREILDALQPRPGKVIVDGTLGGGGHTRLLAEQLEPSGRVIALDRDPAAVAAAEQTLRGLPVSVATSSYADFAEALQELAIERVDGFLLDLGLSSDQLADPERGFSFEAEGDLDMRFNPDEGEPAWRLLERMRAEEIADIIFRYGEERFSRRIARAVVDARREHPVRTARELAQLVRRCVPRSKDQIDPATRTFQALRIAVNDELGELQRALRAIPERLNVGGRVAIISFHSLEDRIVKEAFRSNEQLQPLTRKPITASENELRDNPRSRSAKLRVAERLH
jgi:16S rRNA (cytosine1402-N4)-methyltransferase